MAAEDAGGSGDLAILVNTEMIILKGAVKAAFSLPTDSILYETT